MRMIDADRLLSLLGEMRDDVVRVGKKVDKADTLHRELLKSGYRILGQIIKVVEDMAGNDGI